MHVHVPRAALLVATIGFGATALPGPASADQALARSLAESNVNQQYVVESVSISGVEFSRYRDSRLSSGLRRRLAGLIGAPCDMAAIGDLSARIRSTLHLQDVKEHLSRGSSPDRVRVDFEIVHKDYSFDLSVPRFLYDSDQGWTAELNASARAHQQTVEVGLGSNGDDLVERFTGFSTRYADSHIFSDHIGFSVGIEGYHDLWNPATRRAVSAESSLNDSAPGASNVFALYRTRRNIAPAVTFALSRELSVSVGASFERMEMEAPSPSGSEMSMSANAATVDVNFGYSVEDGSSLQRWDGRYGLRLATRELGSDYVYSRQYVSVRYEWKSGRRIVSDRMIAGMIAGHAPLFERFALGNSSTLPGWNRYAIDPLGGDRMVHDTLSCGYQFQQGTAEVFYDAGIVGDGDRLGTLRHSVGIGFRQSIFNIAMAFPVYQGRIAPVFLAGMNY